MLTTIEILALVGVILLGWVIAGLLGVAIAILLFCAVKAAP